MSLLLRCESGLAGRWARGSARIASLWRLQEHSARWRPIAHRVRFNMAEYRLAAADVRAVSASFALRQLHFVRIRRVIVQLSHGDLLGVAGAEKSRAFPSAPS